MLAVRAKKLLSDPFSVFSAILDSTDTADTDTTHAWSDGRKEKHGGLYGGRGEESTIFSRRKSIKYNDHIHN